MNKKSFCKVFLFLFLLCIIWLGMDSESQAYTINDIGKFTTNESISGVKIYYDGKLLNYSLDIWKNNGSGWYYAGSEVDGKAITTKNYEHYTSAIALVESDEWTTRFHINLSLLFSKIPEGKYSIVTDKQYQGKYVHHSVETPYENGVDQSNLCSLLDSLNKGDATTNCGTFCETSPSYTYHLYKILNIGKQGGIYTGGSNYQVTAEGEAYYNGSAYVIHSLPVATPQIEGYRCTSFDGWYDQPAGGKKYNVGDTLQKSTILYPRWNKTPLKYPVKCIDILGNGISGKTIGEHSWEQEYDSKLSGSQKGCVNTESAYYEGTVYTGCTEMFVRTAGNTVYRYFSYASYPVQIIDQISGGPGTGKNIGNVSRQYTYGTTVSGDVLGNLAQIGAYYPGYLYSNATSTVVRRSGGTVYRYFTPIRYHISLDGNGSSGGAMAAMENCWYDQSYELTANSYKKEIHINLDLQAEEATCDTDSIVSKQDFIGWSESPDGGVRYSDKAVVKNLMDQSGSCTLYACWDAADVSISAQPKRMGYQFAGWSENPEATSGKTEFSLLSDTTLYAVWKADVVTYHVEYHKETTQGDFQLAANYQFSNYSGTKVSIADSLPSYPGFHLDTDSSVLEGTVSGDGSQILIAYYRRNLYHLTLDSGLQGTDGSDRLDMTGVFEQEIVIPECLIEKNGYYFAGWTEEEGGSQIQYKAGDSYRVPNHDQVLYAVWEPKSYQISFDANIPAEAEEQEKGLMEPVTCYYGQSLQLPACSWERKGYQFTGWNTKADGTGDFYQDAQTIDSLYDKDSPVVTLYGIWKAVTGEIAFAPNLPEQCSGTLSGSMENMAFCYDQSQEAPACLYQLSGYDFDSWNTKADGSGKRFSPGDDIQKIFSCPEGNTLYAIWKARNDTPFMLRLDKEGSDGISDTEIILCSGVTDSVLSEAVPAYYAAQGETLDWAKFRYGYEISNLNQLAESRVQANGETIMSLQLERKEYPVSFVWDAADQESEIYFQEKIKYGLKYTLPKEIPGIAGVGRYQDAEGNVYEAGEQVTVNGNLNFMIQHRLVICQEGKKIEQYVLRDMPVVLEKPEERVYSFEGWYGDPGFRDYIGTGQSVVYLKQNTTLYPKWSEQKIQYRISYRLDGESIIIDGRKDSYYSGDSVCLPTASQVVVPAGYQFVGWYEMDDPDQTICTEICEEQYGDKVFCLKLKALERPGKEDTYPEPAVPDTELPPLPETTVLPEQSGTEDVSGSGGDGQAGEILTGKDPMGKDPAEKNPTGENPTGVNPAENNPAGKDPAAEAGQSNSPVPDSRPSTLGSEKRNGKSKLEAAIAKRAGETEAAPEFTKAGIRYRILSQRKRTVTVLQVKSRKKKISIPRTVKTGGIRYRVIRIGAKAFRNCPKTTEIRIASGMQKVSKKVFSGMRTASGGRIRLLVPTKEKKRYQKIVRQSKNRQIIVATY